jgi:SpoVK/Ycf46/Vps4 family AAA+-type ATPase
LRSESFKPSEDMYDLVKLPDKNWQRRGKLLVFDPGIERDLLRFAQFRLTYGVTDGTSGLMMLTGPPGTGKSDAARWAADAVLRKLSLSGNALVINTEALFDENLGGSAKRITALSDAIVFSAARQPTILIWDDAEGIFMSRHQSVASKDPTDCVRVTTTLNACLDRLRFTANVVQFATLNIEGLVDAAIVSRNDFVLPFSLPTEEDRRKILSHKLQGTAGERVLAELAAATDGWSGRDLTKINLKAYLKASADTLEDLTEADYLRAVGLTPDAAEQDTTADAVQEEVQTSPMEENKPCTSLSNNGFRAAALLQKSKSLFARRRFNPQPTS